jgi:membrane fusion protein, multidrug efflux system
VIFTLPQSAIGAVRGAMAAGKDLGPAVEVRDQEGGALLDRGRLIAIDNRVDDASGSVTLKAVFPNASNQLWPGQQVTAHLVLGVDTKAVSVPASALQSNASGSYVWVIDKSDRAALRPVSAGPRSGDRVVIVRGLAGGERVVTDGQFALSAGTRVAIATPAAAATARHDNPDQLGLNP